MTNSWSDRYADLKRKYKRDVVLTSGSKKPNAKQLARYNSSVQQVKVVTTDYLEMQFTKGVKVFFYNL